MRGGRGGNSAAQALGIERRDEPQSCEWTSVVRRDENNLLQQFPDLCQLLTLLVDAHEVRSTFLGRCVSRTNSRGGRELLRFVVAGVQEFLEKSPAGGLKAFLEVGRVSKRSVLLGDDRRGKAAGRLGSGGRPCGVFNSVLHRAAALPSRSLQAADPPANSPTPNKRISFFRYAANCKLAPEARARCIRIQKDHRHLLTTDY